MILRAFVIGLLFTTPAVAAAAAANEARTVGLEVLRDGLVLAPVAVNGSGPHLFLLDTGGASTVVSATLARQLGLIPAGSHRIETMSGSRTVSLTRVDELRLGSETFTAVDVLWMDLTHVQAGDSRIQGVIGQDLLRTRSFLLDYEARRLTFDPVASPAGATGVRSAAATWDGRRLPLDWSGGRPVVRAVGHHTARGGAGCTSAALRFVIDSGGTHVILFDQSGAARSLVNALRAGATANMTMSTHGGTCPVMTATVDRIELTEGMALRGVMAALVPMDPGQGRIEDGLLPASLFRAIYFDNRAGEVVLRTGGRSW